MRSGSVLCNEDTYLVYFKGDDYKVILEEIEKKVKNFKYNYLINLIKIVFKHYKLIRESKKSLHFLGNIYFKMQDKIF
jgi:hypothetical protein